MATPWRRDGRAHKSVPRAQPETWGQQTTFRAASGPQGRYRDPWPASHPVQGPHAVGGWQAWGPVHPSRPVGAGYLSNGRGLPRRLDTKAARCWEARRHTLCCAACRTCSSWVSCSLERSMLTISGTCGHTAMAVRPRGTPVPAAIPRGQSPSPLAGGTGALGAAGGESAGSALGPTAPRTPGLQLLPRSWVQPTGRRTGRARLQAACPPAQARGAGGEDSAAPDQPPADPVC